MSTSGKRIRVLFCIGSLGGGGAERQVLHVLEGIDRSQFEPMLYLMYRKGELLEQVPRDVPIFFFAEAYEPARIPFPGLLFLKHAANLANTVAQAKVELIYARTSLMAMIAARAARKHNVPWVAVEAIDPHTGFDDYHRRFTRIKRWLVKRAYASANRVVAVSDGVRSAIIHAYHLPPEHVITVHNFLDLAEIDRLSSASVDLEQGNFHVITAGRLHPQKGHQYLLEAADLLVNQQGRKNLVFHFLGAGPEEDALRAHVAAHGLENHVLLHGFVENPYAWFKVADLFVLPSLYEGMPNALLEAMACGAPAIATDCPSGPREATGQGEYACLVPPADSQALANAIVRAMQNPDEWRNRAARAMEWVRNTFSRGASLARLEAILKDVYDEAARPI